MNQPSSPPFDVIIPARFGSSRLPGKPLADINGLPMIEHVYRRACKSNAERVLVATDDERVATVVRAFGGRVCMTAADHASGTDRLQEVAAELKLADDRIVVNVQGDEPLIPPAVIDQLAANLAAHPNSGVATLAEPIDSLADFCNPNVVKVVADGAGCAHYFSRAPIPWPRDAFANNPKQWPVALKPRRHIGLYAYRVALLNRFVHWPVAPMEHFEALEQLRFLHHGETIQIADALAPVPGGVDTQEDLARLRGMLAGTSAE